MENRNIPWLQRIWLAILNPHPEINDIVQNRQISLVAIISLGFIILSLPGSIPLINQMDLTNPATVGFLVSYALVFLSFILNRTRAYRLARILLVISFLEYAFYQGIVRNDHAEIITSIQLFLPLAFIVGAGVLMTEELSLIVVLSVIGLVGIGIGKNIPYTELGSTVGAISFAGAFLSIINGYHRDTEQRQLNELRSKNLALQQLSGNLEERFEEKTRELNRRSAQLEASALVARAAAEFQDLNDLINNVVHQISDRFEYYHAGVFLVEPSRRFMVLQAASSEGGKRMLEHGHKLEIGRQGIVGSAAYQKRPRVAQNVGEDASYFNNPYLPETRSEIALPLTTQGKLLGVLDIQSKDNNAFSEEDIYTMQTMADQIALAIENARLFAESQSALQELQRISFQNTLATWRDRLAAQQIGFVYTPLGIRPLKEKTEETLAENNPKVLQLPVRLRGQTIGKVSLRRKPADPSWTERERELAEKIADQIALALDNARVLEESQRRYAREQTLNEFTGRFSRSLNVETLLQNAVKELHRIPQVAEVAVLINPTETE